MKSCRQCKNQFEITDKDRAFYLKMQVPEPTLCPECRMQRRFAWRNEQTLYNRVCDKTGKNLISMYPPRTRFPVWDLDTWWNKDVWDAREYGRDFDFNRPFFEQFAELIATVPRPHIGNLSNASSINSEYTNCAGEMKNCYLIFGAAWNEECLYSTYIEKSYRCMDTLLLLNCRLCYECVSTTDCYNVYFSESAIQCIDSYFLYDCRNCSNCIGCVGLRNKSYCIFNEQLDKESYEKKKGELIDGSRAAYEAVRQQWQKLLVNFPRRYYHGLKNENFSGDYVRTSIDSYYMFDVANAKDCKFCTWMIHGKDTYDYFAWGDIEFSYECVSCGFGAYHLRFCSACYKGNNALTYCDLCQESHDLFGCVAINGGSYCILNKQYSKEEYETLVPRIIEHMKKTGEWGEYFPIALSPYSYNDTVAQNYYTLTKEECTTRGWAWQDDAPGTYGKETLHAENIPDVITKTDVSICKELLACTRCKKNYKIVKQEFELYKTFNVPVPLLCFQCRFRDRFLLRTPRRLWHRACQNQGCTNEFETTYAPDRPEKVYCEECYNKEVV